MSVKAKLSTSLTGEASRAIDFNLKKEDLMLLILEGRKEVMEEEIQKLQNKESGLRTDMHTAQRGLEEEIKSQVTKTLNSEVTKFLPAGETDLNKIVDVKLSTGTDPIKYTKYVSKPIGDGRGGAYIKEQYEQNLDVYCFTRVTVSLRSGLRGTVFGKKSSIYLEEVGPQPFNSFDIIRENLNLEHQKTLPAYVKYRTIAEEFAKTSSLLSDLIAEYDLFNRNQPRSKAKMIKEVLSRDSVGQDMLLNIAAAAKGVKLLS